MSDFTNPSAAFHSHDHSACAGSVLECADQLVAQEGLRLTPVRRRTLEILLEEHRAMGAYEVLEKLSSEGFGKQPPVAYRALEFLVDCGFVHRIRRLNAFMACAQPNRQHRPAFFICHVCNAVAETSDPEVSAALSQAAQKLGFQISRTNVEVLGTCPNCIGSEK